MNSRPQTDHSQLTHHRQLEIAHRFHAALVARDWSAMRALLTDDVQWTLPGNNTISGTANGADAVVDRARKIASYGLNFELLHILVSRNNVALSLHNTGRGRVNESSMSIWLRSVGSRTARLPRSRLSSLMLMA
jgi:uncharacterized protein